MKFRTLESSRTEKLIRDIIRNEMLEVTVTNGVDALGDSYIEVAGNKEEITVLKTIFNMVA